MKNRNTGLTGVQQVTALALRSHAMADSERLAEITRAVCASPTMKKTAARSDRDTRRSAAHAHVTAATRDDSRPAIRWFMTFNAPFVYGLMVYGGATRRQFEAALPKALARLLADCGRVKILAEGEGDGEDLSAPLPKAMVLGDSETGYYGQIEFSASFITDILTSALPEIKDKVRELYRRARQLHLQRSVNQEVSHA